MKQWEWNAQCKRIFFLQQEKLTKVGRRVCNDDESNDDCEIGLQKKS